MPLAGRIAAPLNQFMAYVMRRTATEWSIVGRCGMDELKKIILEEAFFLVDSCINTCKYGHAANQRINICHPFNATITYWTSAVWKGLYHFTRFEAHTKRPCAKMLFLWI